MSGRLIFERVGAGAPYPEMLTRQREQCAAVAKGEAENTVFLLEHAPVITLGREADRAHLLLGQEALTAQGVSVVETDRGGDVTYHGPGQLVAYPILDLRQWRQSVGWYLRRLEQVLIDQLRDYGLQGERVEGLTGVWVADAKVAAVGIGLRNWVTFHGIALNVTTNMDHFGFIVPCGIQDKPVTSLEVLLGKRCPTLEVATDDFVRHFERVFSEAV